MKSHRRAPTAPPSARGKWSKIAMLDRCARADHPLIHRPDNSHHCSCGERRLDARQKVVRGDCPTCDEGRGEQEKQ